MGWSEVFGDVGEMKEGQERKTNYEYSKRDSKEQHGILRLPVREIYRTSGFSRQIEDTRWKERKRELSNAS